MKPYNTCNMQKERTMARLDWDRITKRRYLAKDYSLNGIPGRISLLIMDSVSREMTVQHLGKPVTIVAEGYSWLQLALHGEYFWFTAMFDENDVFQQIYVDITDGNTANVEDAHFTDMYLDYVLLPDRIVELDMDELEQALSEGQISREQFDRTYAHGKQVLSWLETEHTKLIELVTKEQQQLKKEMQI